MVVVVAAVVKRGGLGHFLCVDLGFRGVVAGTYVAEAGRKIEAMDCEKNREYESRSVAYTQQ